MTTFDSPPVLLAVGSDADIEAALEVAAAEAVRAGCGLHLLHVLHAYPVSPAEAAVGYDTLVATGREMLAEVATRAERLVQGRAVVTRELDEGPVVRSIVDRSAEARLVVLQRRSAGRVERLVIGSVSNGVASRAHVPVLCVPAGWSPDNGRRAVVTVGVEDPKAAGAVMRAGLRAGAERGAAVRLVHTWWFTEPYDDAVFTDDRVREWTKRLQKQMRASLEALAPDTDLEIEVVARHRRPADQLVEESQHAQLVVVGRRDPRLPFGSHLGPVARAVLRHSGCPVLVVEPDAPTSREDALDEASDAVVAGR